MQDIRYFQLIAMVGILLMTVIAALAPLRLTHYDPHKRDRVLAFFSFFTGGVFLGAGMLHMLPDAAKNMSSYHFPWVYVVACAGFITIWGLEKVNLGADTPVPSSNLVAVAASAQEKGASICYVSINPVTTYGGKRGATGLGSKRSSVNNSTSNSTLSAAQLTNTNPNPIATLSTVPPPPTTEGVTVAINGTPSTVVVTQTTAAITSTTTPTITTTKTRLKPGQDDDQQHGYQQSHNHSHGHSHGHGHGRHGHSHGHSHGHPPLKSRTHSFSQDKCSDHHSLTHSYEHRRPHQHIKSRCDDDVNESTGLLHNHYNNKDVATPMYVTRTEVTSITDSSSNPDTSPDSSSHPPASPLHDHSHDSIHHHHIVISGTSVFLPFVLALLFSIHSFIEGIALGVQTTVSGGCISITIAICSHKIVEALTVGSNFIKENVNFRSAIPVILVYCLMTPLGIAAGMVAEDLLGETKIVQAMLQAFAAGSFLYLTVHEVTDEKCCHLVSALWQFILVVAGFIAMAILAVYV